MLGHMIDREQSGSDATGANANVRSQKAKLRRGHEQARQETFGDLGFQ